MGCHQIVTYACQNAGDPSSDVLKSGFFTISSQTDWDYSLENFNIVTGWSVVWLHESGRASPPEEQTEAIPGEGGMT